MVIRSDSPMADPRRRIYPGLWIVVGVVALLGVILFIAPVLLTRATVKAVQSPAAAERTTQDRDAAKSEIPK